MTETLAGRHALVTGSTGGMGEGIARALAEAGASIMLNGFGDATEIETLRAGMAAEFGVKVAYHGADVADPAQVAALVAATERRFGTLDILCNNAGIQHVATFEEFPVERWDVLIAVLLSAPFHAIRAALPGMKAHGWGRIINTSSVSGLKGAVKKAAYIAAKHGVIGLTKVVALETAECGITCNAICPGWVLTGMSRPQIEFIAQTEGVSIEAASRILLAGQPTKKFITGEEIGALAAYLCSDAAGQITGTALSIDGGVGAG
jgi:3-hydroxybutyrate dehydrogenase